MQSPCRECNDRKINCHAHCEKYQGYHEERENMCNQKHKQAEIDGFIHERTMRLRNRWIKNRRRW